MGQALSVDDFVLQTACEAREHRLQSQINTKRKRNRKKAKGKSSYVRREEHVRSCLEVLTRSSWPSTRKLHWLVGENGRHLELDCYSHRHACAVEVQGEHHYKFSPFYHKTRCCRCRRRCHCRPCCEDFRGSLFFGVQSHRNKENKEDQHSGESSW